MPWLSRVTPVPGAVAPSIVTLPLVTRRRLSRAMVPATAKPTLRGPSARRASRKVPGPLSARLVTVIVRPPSPPLEMAPNPSGGSERVGPAWGNAWRVHNTPRNNPRSRGIGKRPAGLPRDRDMSDHSWRLPGRFPNELRRRRAAGRLGLAVNLQGVLAEILIGKRTRLSGRSRSLAERPHPGEPKIQQNPADGPVQ